MAKRTDYEPARHWRVVGYSLRLAMPACPGWKLSCRRCCSSVLLIAFVFLLDQINVWLGERRWIGS